MRLKIVAIAVATILAAGLAHAAQYRYRWQDANGVSHYSDSLTSEAIRNGYDIINDQGMVVRHVERALSAKERAARAIEQKRQQAAARAAAQQAQDDRQMLTAYPTEADFKTALQAEIDTLSQHMHTTQLNLHSQEQNLAQLLEHAAEIERAGKQVPKFLNDRIANQRKAITDQRATLANEQRLQAQARRDADAKLAHYRELRAKQKAEAAADADDSGE